MEACVDTLSSELQETLARSKAQIESGETVRLEPFFVRLRESIPRMKTRRHERDTLAGAP